MRFGRLLAGTVATSVLGLVVTTFATSGLAAAAVGEPATCDGQVATEGTTVDDGVATGTDGDDVIIVDAGVTEVWALEGDDTVCQVAGYDDFASASLHGGEGDDRMFGSEGHQRLYGGPGNDYLYGGYANDTFAGGAGDDELDGSCEGCTFEGRYDDLADFSAWGHGDVVVDLLAGVAVSRNGTDTLVDIADVRTGAGDDDVRGDANRNRIWTGPGVDRLVGRRGPDSLVGEKGRDHADGGKDDDACQAERRVRCET